MLATVSVEEAASNFAELLARVTAGEEVVIASGGEPVARLSPVEKGLRRQRIPDLDKGKIWADGMGVGGVGVVDDAAAGEQREPDGDGEAEGVEEGQHADDAVAGIDPEELGDGFDIANQVVVGEHDALGDAGGSAGEDDGGQAIWRAASARQERGGGKARGEEGAQFGQGSGAGEEVFEVDAAG